MPVYPSAEEMNACPGANELQGTLVGIREELDSCYRKISEHCGWMFEVKDGSVFNPEMVAKNIKSQLSQTEAKVHKLESKKVDGLLISHIPQGIVYVRAKLKIYLKVIYKCKIMVNTSFCLLQPIFHFCSERIISARHVSRTSTRSNCSRRSILTIYLVTFLFSWRMRAS